MTVQLRPDLDEAAAAASTRKGILGMTDDCERHRLMEIALHVSALAQQVFDCLEADAMSERDGLTVLQLPDYCNALTMGLRQHANRKLAARAASGPSREGRK